MRGYQTFFALIVMLVVACAVTIPSVQAQAKVRVVTRDPATGIVHQYGWTDSKMAQLVADAIIHDALTTGKRIICWTQPKRLWFNPRPTQKTFFVYNIADDPSLPKNSTSRPRRK
jgi:hypothetical protein